MLYMQYLFWTGESGMIDEAQKLLDEAEALKKVGIDLYRLNL